MKKKSIISWIVLIFIVGVFAWYISQNIEGFKNLSLVRPWLIIAIILLQVAFLVDNGLMLKLFMSPFNIRLKFREWFGLSVITSFGNYFVPGVGGAASRAVYFKKKYGFSYSRFLGNLAGNYVLVFLVNSFVALVVLTAAWFIYGFWNWFLFGVFALIFIIANIFVFFRIRPFKSSYLHRINGIIEGWEFVRRDSRLVFGIVLIGFMNVIIYSLLIFIEFRVFGFEIGLIDSTIIAVTSMLAIFVNVTPAGLGIKESLVVLTSTVFAISPEIAVSVALIDRAINLIVVFILGPIFSYILMKKTFGGKNEK